MHVKRSEFELETVPPNLVSAGCLRQPLNSNGSPHKQTHRGTEEDSP